MADLVPFIPFLYQHGAIKSQAKCNHWQLCLDFYTSMVRLKEKVTVDRVDLYTQFLYQHGAIKSLICGQRL